MKVLVVDDQSENLYLLVQLLKTRNCEVTEATNGVEALEKARAKKFDLIISDIMMPEMDGFQFCHRVKTDPEIKDTTFVFYTATYTDSKDEALALSLGANAFIIKPMEPDQFLSEIDQILRKRSEGKVLPHQNPPEEATFLRQYNQRLVHKLEGKVLELESANKQLKELTGSLQARIDAARAELLEKNAELESFAYSMSHDLRAPLRTISGMASILKSDLKDKLDSEQEELFERLLKGAEHMHQLLSDVLNYSQVTNAAVLLTPVDMDSVLKQALQQVSGRLQETQGTVNVTTPLSTVIAYEAVLVQIFANLLDNSLKFVPVGTPPIIKVSEETFSNRAVIKVEDNGIGIDPEIHAKIFKAFERGVSDKSYSGSGIGLAIVKKGVERMGGSVNVISMRGKGSCFAVELPLAKS